MSKVDERLLLPAGQKESSRPTFRLLPQAVAQVVELAGSCLQRRL